MKADLQALVNKAKDSLGAARSLIRDGYHDFAASRAYYAMFYFHITSDSRFNEYNPSRPLIGFGFFSCFE